VFAAADLNKAIGDSAAEQAVLERGIAATQNALGGADRLDLKRDRNAADNLRVYLVRAGRIADVDALMPKLIAAYPDDYVYPYRFGRSLLERGKAAEALPYLEQAAAKAFGVNRLTVAGLRAKALIALNRRADAEKVVADALEANGPWFPEAAAKLKAIVKA
jgi:predicted Zn-dependent protease